MTTLIKSLLNDEAGFIISAELVLVSTLSLLAISAGLSAASNALNAELQEMSGTLRSFGQTQRQAASALIKAPQSPNDAASVSIVGRSSAKPRQLSNANFVAVTNSTSNDR